jgi:hypothetical protein
MRDAPRDRHHHHARSGNDPRRKQHADRRSANRYARADVSVSEQRADEDESSEDAEPRRKAREVMCRFDRGVLNELVGWRMAHPSAYESIDNPDIADEDEHRGRQPRRAGMSTSG